MSERFKSQDYFRYKKLGKKWRRPVGIQSKMKISKGGSGRVPSIGYGSDADTRGRIRGLDYVIVNNTDQLGSVGSKAALIAGGVGRRKTLMIVEKAKEMNITIVNRNKVRDAKRFAKSMEKRKQETKKKKEEAKKEEAKAQEKKAEHKKETKKEEAKKEEKHDHEGKGHEHKDEKKGV